MKTVGGYTGDMYSIGALGRSLGNEMKVALEKDYGEFGCRERGYLVFAFGLACSATSSECGSAYGLGQMA